MAETFDEAGNIDYGSVADNMNATPMSDGSSPSMLSVDYYRQKVIEYQKTLDSLDGIFFDLQMAGPLLPQDSDSFNEWVSLVDQFDSRRAQFRTVAEALNAASAGLGYIGVDFPSVKIPNSLGLPLIPVAVVAGVLASAYVLVQWARMFAPIVSDSMKRWQQSAEIQSLPEADRAQALVQMAALAADVEKKRDEIDNSSLSSAASLAKWAVIAGIAFIGYKIWKEAR